MRRLLQGHLPRAVPAVAAAGGSVGILWSSAWARWPARDESDCSTISRRVEPRLLRYRVDPERSRLGFTATRFGYDRVPGIFPDFGAEGEIDLRSQPTGWAKGHVAAASIDTALAWRDYHLRGEDFFAVEEFPEMQYETSEVLPQQVCDADGTCDDRRFHVKGVAEIRGVRGSLDLDVEILPALDVPGEFDIHASGQLDRKQFGVGRRIPEYLISRDVQLRFQLRVVEASR
mmetsp:Transcript_38636/g.70300  ORF Transcript_38636/g.70300 Transcript_38636/m.70300 type:complete len:231 (-) Transcript_38636:100-792(-)